MFLYVMNYLVGYDAWTIDELKGYGSPKENGYHTLCHGHPERQAPAVEVTTGPLGQGVANAVGLAIASKNLAATFNKPGCELIQSTIWCTTGDGCLMEGVALEGMHRMAKAYDESTQLINPPQLSLLLAICSLTTLFSSTTTMP